LEGVGDDGLVGDADLIGEAPFAERLDRPFELPGRRVRTREREVPRDVVLEDGRLAGRERARHAGQLAETVDVVEDRFGPDAEEGDDRFGNASHSSFKVSCAASSDKVAIPSSRLPRVR